MLINCLLSYTQWYMYNSVGIKALLGYCVGCGQLSKFVIQVEKKKKKKDDLSGT